MTKNSTSFSSENQPDYKPGRGKSERTKILEAMKRAGKDEQEFYDLLVERATNSDDSFTFKELLSRLSPVPKQVAPLVEFNFKKTDSPSDQAICVLDAIAKGEIPSDIGNVFIQSIKSMIDIDEYTILKDRIKSIEDSLGISNV